MKRVFSITTPIVFLLASLAILSSSLTPPPAHAIPAFARKYAVNCMVCHVRVPRLNQFGQRFLENGYQMPGTEDGGIIGKLKYGDLTLDEVSKYFAVLFATNAVQHLTFKRNVSGSDNKTEIGTRKMFRLFTAGTITTLGETQWTSSRPTILPFGWEQKNR